MKSKNMCQVFSSDLSKRSSEPELMDDLSGDEDILKHTLSDFKFINRYLARSRYLVSKFILSDIKQKKMQSVAIADLGAGGCDFARWVIPFFEKRSIQTRVICIDNDPRAVSFAQKACVGYKSIDIRKMSALDINTLDEPIDYIYSNHFLHHIEEDHIPELIRKMYAKANHAFLVSDLSRSRLSLILFSLLGLFLFHKRFTIHDGLISIKKGFTLQELKNFEMLSGLSCQGTIGRLFPGRVFYWCNKSNSR